MRIPKRQLEKIALLGFLCSAVVIGVLAIFLRTWKPQLDVAFDICFCQSENIDWTWSVEEPLAKEQLTNSDPSCEMYHHAFFTAYERLIFKLFGYSSEALVYSSFLPSLLTIGFLAFALYDVTKNKWHALSGAFLASSSFLLVEYSRVPGVYPWIMALEFPVAFLWVAAERSKRWSVTLRVLSLALIFFFSLTLKNITLFYLAPLFIAAFLYRPLKRKVKQIATISLVVFAIVLALEPYSHLFISIWKVFAPRLMPLDSWMNMSDTLGSIFPPLYLLQYRFLMPLVFASLASCIFIAKKFGGKKKPPFLDAFAMVIFLLGNLLYAFEIYHPVRYFLFLAPTAIYLGIRCYAYAGAEIASLKPRWRKNAQTALLVAAFLTIGFVTLRNLKAYAVWMSKGYNTWVQNREDMEEILPPDAVAVGPYAQFFRYGTGRPAYRLPANRIIALHPADVVPPSTHTIIDTHYNLGRMSDNSGPDWLLLDHLYVRGYEVAVLRMPQTDMVSRSLFEEGAYALRDGNVDMAREYWEKSMAKFPGSAASVRALLLLALREHNGLKINEYLKEALRRNPTHPFPWYVLCDKAKDHHDAAVAGRACRRLAETSFNTPFYLQKMEEALKNDFAPQSS